jgi:hypothetical protein
MAQWRKVLHIASEWKQAKEHEITIQQLAKSIADKLKEFDPDSMDDDIQYFIESFNSISNSSNNDGSEIETFDEVMESLYNWADMNSCWIETIV